MNDIERYVALANLKKLDQEKTYILRAKGNPNARVPIECGDDDWYGFQHAYEAFHVEEFWHIVRSLAVLDWVMRKPDRFSQWRAADPGMDMIELPVGNFTDKFETIMRNVQKLALQIQEEQGYTDSQKPN